MNHNYTSVKEQIEYGLEEIDENLSVKVPVKDLMYVFKTLEQLNSFFHQEDHYKSIKDVTEFIGNREKGIYEAIAKCYYEKIWNNLPEEIKEKIEQGETFENPKPPYYYKK